MLTRLKRRDIVASLCATAALAALAGPAAAQAPSGQPIKIGFSMALTGRPSRPPLALVSSSQIFMPSSACLPLAASGPVSAMEKPMVIGWPDGA